MNLRAEGLAAPHGVATASLTLAAGEQVAVIGPSGAGKTTLLHLLAGAVRPTAGLLRVDGADPWALPPGARRALRRRLALAPQVPPLPPRQRVATAVLAGALARMTAWQALRALVHPTPAQAAEARAALAPLGLAEALWQRVDRLSGGERQRVALARLLLAPATLWLADEPLAALDPVRAAQALGVLGGAARARGATLVVSLHQVDAALAQFDRIVGLRAGRVAFDLPRAQVTSERLTALYAGATAAPPPREPPPAPLPMAC